MEAELSDDAAMELVLKVINEEQQKQILNPNWKERLAGLQAAFQVISTGFASKSLVSYSIPVRAK